MERREIQRLSGADMTPERFVELARHGEDLLVERKVRIPADEKLGAVVASMANMLGGWILLGVDDKTRDLQELELAAGIDLQSHMGDRLRKAVDPVPPYLAETLEVDGARVGWVRVFQAAVPVLVRGTGAVYSRDDGGKRPISDHRVLLELARSGREAEDEARRRPDRLSMACQVLGLPADNYPIEENHLRTIVRAAPLTVTPQLTEWPVTRGAGACLEAVEWLAPKMGAPERFASNVEPFGKAVAAYAAPLQPPLGPLRLFRAITYADCAGVFAAATSNEAPNALHSHELRSKYIRPVIEAVAELLLTRAEAYGDAVFDLHLVPARELYLFDPERRRNFESNRVPRNSHSGSAILSVPADEDDRAELAKRWEREVARQAGLAMWDPPPG